MAGAFSFALNHAAVAGLEAANFPTDEAYGGFLWHGVAPKAWRRTVVSIDPIIALGNEEEVQ